MSDCDICMGAKRVKVGISFPPGKTIDFKVEYDPCPKCTPGPHSYHSRLTMQGMIETRKRRAHADGGEG